MMLPLTQLPDRITPPDSGPGCGCVVAVACGLLLWAAWTLAVFMAGRLSAFVDVLAK